MVSYLPVLQQLNLGLLGSYWGMLVISQNKKLTSFVTLL